jgi:hypothetical protein
MKIASRLLRPFHIYNISIDLEKSLYILTKHYQTGHDSAEEWKIVDFMPLMATIISQNEIVGGRLPHGK